MKKLLPFVILLALLLSGCGPNLPYKVWEDFDQMKIDIGDHFLYPTYIPEGLDNITSQSWYNSTLFKERAKDPYYEYRSWAYTGGGDPIFCIFAIDPSLKRTTMGDSDQTYESEVIESRTEEIMGFEVSVTTIYTRFRTTLVEFEIDGILYTARYESGNILDKNTDPVQMEELLKVAKSIIEQTVVGGKTYE